MLRLRLLLVAGITAALGLILSATALGAGTSSSPFSVLPPSGDQTTSTPTSVLTTTTSSGNGSFGAVDAIIIAVIVLGLIIGIAFFVWRNSRQTVAHLGREPSGLGPGEGRHQGSKAPHKQRKLSAAERKRRKRGRAPRRR